MAEHVSGSTHTYRAPRGLTPLWFGISAAPTAFALNLVFSYAFEQHSCSTGTMLWMHVFSFVSLAFALAGGFVSFSQYRELGGYHEDEEKDDVFTRAYWMAMVGMGESIIFGCFILANLITKFVVDPCTT